MRYLIGRSRASAGVVEVPTPKQKTAIGNWLLPWISVGRLPAAARSCFEPLEPLTGSSPRQIDFLHMRVLVVAHFAAIPSYLHKIAIDVDDSADSLFLPPEHTLSDFEQSGLGWMHDSRTITYFGKFREPMLTSGTHTNFVGARSIFFISLCRTKSVSLSSQAMVTPLQAVRMIVLGTSALLRLLPGATGRKNALKGVTNDVLYQLSYCGGPKSLSSENASSGMSVSRPRARAT
jgi:hypothetical protein